MNRDKLIARQGELIKILQAIEGVLKSKEWQTLQELEFSGMVERLERQLLTEAKSPEIKVEKIYKLQGEIDGVKRVDLRSFAEKRKLELEGIKQKLKTEHSNELSES